MVFREPESQYVVTQLQKGEFVVRLGPGRSLLLYIPKNIATKMTRGQIYGSVAAIYQTALNQHPLEVTQYENSLALQLPPADVVPDLRLSSLKVAILADYERAAEKQKSEAPIPEVQPTPVSLPEPAPVAEPKNILFPQPGPDKSAKPKKKEKVPGPVKKPEPAEPVKPPQPTKAVASPKLPKPPVQRKPYAVQTPRSTRPLKEPELAVAPEPAEPPEEKKEEGLWFVSESEFSAKFFSEKAEFFIPARCVTELGRDEVIKFVETIYSRRALEQFDSPRWVDDGHRTILKLPPTAPIWGRFTDPRVEKLKRLIMRACNRH